MKTLKILFTAAVVTVLFSSCYTQGYGCKGNSRIITRVRQ